MVRTDEIYFLTNFKLYYTVLLSKHSVVWQIASRVEILYFLNSSPPPPQLLTTTILFFFFSIIVYYRILSMISVLYTIGPYCLSPPFFFLFFCFYEFDSQIPHVNGIMQCLFLKCIHVVLLNTAGFPYMFSLNVLHCVHAHLLLFPFTHCWTLRLFPYFGFSEECCSEHGSTDTTSRAWFHFICFIYIARCGIAGSNGDSC